ncbi:MAG: hypothetical protein WCG08_07825 [Paludibacter sp.]|jgi:hypothetical protein
MEKILKLLYEVQKEMSAKINLAKNKIAEMEAEIDKRNDFYESKSDKWKDSDKGTEYSEKTEELEDEKSEIEDLLYVFTDFLSDIDDKVQFAHDYIFQKE